MTVQSHVVGIFDSKPRTCSDWSIPHQLVEEKVTVYRFTACFLTAPEQLHNSQPGGDDLVKTHLVHTTGPSPEAVLVRDQ